jgi:hypothetical protein
VKAAASSAHPSFLALDRHALGLERPEIVAHVAGCATCRAHVAAVEPPSEAPAWALRLGPRRAPGFAWWPLGPRLRALRWGALAFASAFVLWRAAGHFTTGAHIGGYVGGHAGAYVGTYVGTKGDPVLWLYVKHGERVELWNGSDPVHPGDLLRLKVQPDRYQHISVFGRARAPHDYVTLYDAPVPSGQPTALPFSWKVDAQPGDETLLIVLGPASVSPAEVADVLARGAEGRYWSRRLSLVKALARGGASP